MAKYSELKEAFDIFVKYKDDFLEADHDIIYGPSLDTNFTDEEKATLEKLGWWKNDEFDCWAAFC